MVVWLVIPSEIEFSEVQPFLLLPSTNHLLFKGFYEKYKYYNQKIKELDVEIDEIPYEKFVDETHTFDEKIEKENEEKLRQLEAEQRQIAKLEALQRELKLSEQRWKDEVREQQRRAEAMQREAQRQAWYREDNSRAIARQVGKIAESQKQLEIYGESFYNKYH